MESLDELIFLEDFNVFPWLKESVLRRKSWTSPAKNLGDPGQKSELLESKFRDFELSKKSPETSFLAS